MNLNSQWRKTAMTIYGPPKDSKLFGAVEMDVTEAENFINAQRKVGNKITLTHLLAWLIGKTISEEIPEMNCFVRRGNVVKRKTVDANISVLMPNNQMGSVLVKNIDTLNI